MSKRIPATLKTELGEHLATWYRHFGKVALRRPYHEDDEGSGDAKPIFEGHPYLEDMPIGAPSDLSSVLISDERTLDETKNRSNELTLELQNRLELTLGQKLEQKFMYQNYTKPQVY